MARRCGGPNHRDSAYFLQLTRDVPPAVLFGFQSRLPHDSIRRGGPTLRLQHLSRIGFPLRSLLRVRLPLNDLSLLSKNCSCVFPLVPLPFLGPRFLLLLLRSAFLFKNLILRAASAASRILSTSALFSVCIEYQFFFSKCMSPSN